MNRFTSSPLAEVHPFIYEALLSLVQVHAQVRSIAKPLVSRTISALVDQVVKVILDSFNRITRFGMGGMLQVSRCTGLGTEIPPER